MTNSTAIATALATPKRRATDKHELFTLVAQGGHDRDDEHDLAANEEGEGEEVQVAD